VDPARDDRSGYRLSGDLVEKFFACIHCTGRKFRIRTGEPAFILNAGEQAIKTTVRDMQKWHLPKECENGVTAI
jgi:hypothetical protein